LKGISELKSEMVLCLRPVMSNSCYTSYIISDLIEALFFLFLIKLQFFLVHANEGDAYPLGALPMGTKVHSVEKITGTGGYYAHSAGVFATILR
jgi:hypothetical protein